MKSLELENFGVQELDAREMLTIEGGSWFSRNWKAVGMIVVGIGIAIGVITA